MALGGRARLLSDERVSLVALALLAVLAGICAGWGAARFSPMTCLAVLLIVPWIVLVLRSVWFSFAATIGVITLLPFFVLPLSVGGASPTLFEIAAAGIVATYIAVLMLDGRERLIVRTPVAFWFLFATYIVFAFMLGARFGLGADLTRLFFRFGLAIALFWMTIQLVRCRREAMMIVTWIVAGASVAAGFALTLYAGGASFTFRILQHLTPYGYPDTRVVRFIEDNPQDAMRAIGTGVDPNAFGGLVMVGFVLAVGLACSRKSGTPVALVWAAIGLTGLAVLLTYSRGAWIGSMVGAGIIVWFRARALVPFAMLAAVAAIAVGVGAAFVSRLEAGLRLQDNATLQRIDEYENAIAIIREHPWFGIGFGSAPSPDFGVGVSSIYLLIAEQTGLVGLGVFILFMLIIGRRGWLAFRRTNDDLVLTVGAALVASLTVGVVDHYFFNIRFVHMVALFWILAGLMVALSEDGFIETEEKGGAG